MTHAQVWQLELPEVSMEEMLKAAGMEGSKRAPRPQVLESYKNALAEAKALIQPKLVWREANIKHNDDQLVQLEDGSSLNSRLLAKVASQADKLLLFVATIGSDIDGRALALQQQGHQMEAFALDAAGTAFIAKTSRLALAKLESQLGEPFSFPMGPGHSYWPGLGDMPTLMRCLAAEQIGVSLATSNLMVPRKSLAMVVGVGANMLEFKEKSHCEFCTLRKSCHLSQAGSC